MISKEIIKYSIDNLRKRKTRSFLTIFSILIGITTIFIFISFGMGLYTYVNSFVSESSADKVLIQPKGVGVPGIDKTFFFDEEDLDAVKKTSGVYEAEGVQILVVEAEQNNIKKFVFMTAYDPERPLMLEISNLEIYEGRSLTSSDRGKVVLGYNYLIEDKIFPRKLEVNSRIDVDGKSLTVVGFYDSVGNPQDDSNIYITNDYFEDIYPENSDKYDMITARVDTSDIDRVITNLEKELRKSRGLEEGKEDFFVSSFGDLFESYSTSLNIIIGFIVLIALISVIVSAINTANTMITSVLERIKEIGVMKSIGARNSEIFNLYLFESSFLGFIAGVLGVFFGWIFSLVAGNILEGLGWSFLSPYYSVELFIGCILFATITGGISGVIPAISASRVNPVDALRYE
ncbi:hypothetical protein COU60_01035 [Candidatus Pacearchaeota archaeon CG10_big_fil_rev_8_21_14_0_10_34_76]|nr:MAG: hypothetical protein COU60_01035 [Candidatus Pacearchaeota archaeon CG10_big_fil_rev_8_21_14_0_10_34_76]